MKRICLIIDNPLRDFDGIVLIAAYLMMKNFEVFIVPMNAQNSDALSLNPDVVLVNYIRKNNLEILNLYKNRGIKVAILDTEGVGKWWPKHAQILRDIKADKFVDQYYCWGKEQHDHLVSSESLDHKKIKITGCPRYDFAVQPWRNTLQPTGIPPGYILINTNFPLANPFFTKNSKTEIKSWINTGLTSKNNAEKFLIKTNELFKEMIKAIETISTKLPEIQFIIRPHPFEDMSVYKKIENKIPNVLVRKEGTSLQWLHMAKALLHINCFTAIEAGFMDIEALALEWVNKKEIRDHSNEPSLVSRNATNIDELINWIKLLDDNSFTISKTEEQYKNLKEIQINNYFGIDGFSAKRVSENLIELANQTSKPVKNFTNKLSFVRLANLKAREFLGYKIYSSIRIILEFLISDPKKRKQIPDLETIEALLLKIMKIKSKRHKFTVNYATKSDFHSPRQAAFKSIKIRKCG